MMIRKRLKKFIPVCLVLAALPVLQTAAAELPVFRDSEPAKYQIPVEVPNCDFEGTGGWVNMHGGAPSYSADSYSGERSAVLSGASSMLKSTLIPLAAGEELRFTAWGKVENLCTITADLAFFDGNRNWLKRGTPPLARADQYVWQQISGSYTNTDPEVKFVVLQFYGAGNLDDIDIRIVRTETDDSDALAIMNNIMLPQQETADMIFLANADYGVWISKESGMLAKLVSYTPDYKIIQPAGVNSMQLYIKSSSSGIDGNFDTVVDGYFDGNNSVVCSLTSSDPAVAEMAEAKVTYTLDGDKFTVTGDIIFKKDDPNNYQCGLRNVFRPDEWLRNICLTFPVSAKEPVLPFLAKSHYSPGDLGVPTINQHYPFCILEGDDRWMVWGDFEIGKFVMLSPNDIYGRLPSQQKNPDSVKAGMVQSFSSNYLILPKYNHDLTQVMWRAIDNVYSNHPLLEGLIKRPDIDGRYHTPGAFAWYHPGSVPPGQDGWRQEMLDRHANNVWYSWWSTWQETNEIEGDWYTYDCRHLSAEGNKREIAYMQDMGLNVYLYFRQFLVEEGTYEDKAPYREWLGRDEAGKRQPFIDHKVQRPEVLGGLEYVRWTCADFGNREFREWYLEKTKRAIDFYEPEGVAWDMGYNAMYSHSEPETGTGAATLWVQAEIYNWLKEKHPDIRIATNESFVNPTALFGDSILIEGAWDVAKKSELDYLLAKAYGITVFSLQLTDDYIIQGAPKVDFSDYSVMRIKARGENLQEAIFAAADIMKHGFKDDGTWQELEIPLTAGSFRIFGVVLKASKDNAYLEIAEAELAGKIGTADYILCNSNTPARDFVSFGKWNHNSPTTGKVEKTADGIIFTADQGGGSKTWSCFTPVIPRMLQINMKVLGLGAICSDAQIPALEDLNSFAAELAAMHHISKQKLIYDLPEKVYGTFWQRDDRTAGCIYNDTGADCRLDLRLDRSAMPDNGDSLIGRELNICLADKNAEVAETGNFEITYDEEAVYINGILPEGNLFIIKNW